MGGQEHSGRLHGSAAAGDFLFSGAPRESSSRCTSRRPDLAQEIGLAVMVELQDAHARVWSGWNRTGLWDRQEVCGRFDAVPASKLKHARGRVVDFVIAGGHQCLTGIK